MRGLLLVQQSGLKSEMSLSNSVADMVKNLQLVSRVDVVHSSECQIDSFFFTIDISGQTVQPIFLCSPFHNQQRSRK